MTKTQTKERLVDRFGIDQHTLDLRKQFIRLGDEDKKILTELIPWAEANAAKIAKEFYDWQFTFERTLAFFTAFAQEKNMTMDRLRAHLEASQAGYFRQIFTGARDGWGPPYFENRLHVGSVHDRINLPFKWYIGAYVEYDVLLHKYLGELWPDEPARVWQAEHAIRKVMNYDVQAIGDSFLMSTLGSIGLSVEAVERPEDGDRTEALIQIKDAVDRLKRQADAIAAGKFDDDSLQTKVPGALGEIFASAVDSLIKLAEQARVISEGRLDDAALETRVPGMLGETFSQMTENLTATILRIQANTKSLSQMASQMKEVSDAMRENAEGTTAQANSASAASEEVSKSIQAIAAAAEEMNSTIREVSRNVTEATKIASQASRMASETDAVVSKLSESSEQINNVVKVITDIAEQTNLLALNATIEAARAGDAGKGFAVVANEVKELAKETTRSTGEIRSQVKRIQEDTHAAVDAIRKIGDIITKINDTQTMIAAAVEQQGATTSDIARSIAEAAKGSQEISRNIAEVAKAASSTQTTAGQTTTAAGELGNMTTDLAGSIAIFSVKKRDGHEAPKPPAKAQAQPKPARR